MCENRPRPQCDGPVGLSSRHWFGRPTPAYFADIRDCIKCNKRQTALWSRARTTAVRRPGTRRELGSRYLRWQWDAPAPTPQEAPSA
ncbi:hypothetical protein LCGC14_1214960 [marine sediment metagenome]|uniref:Uncharacterized protein n=1 Tax=marine sediment metagenome TaxID=412755 RepID=A0A0F9NVA8_9ZZZZ